MIKAFDRYFDGRLQGGYDTLLFCGSAYQFQEVSEMKFTVILTSINDCICSKNVVAVSQQEAVSAASSLAREEGRKGIEIIKVVPAPAA